MSFDELRAAVERATPGPWVSSGRFVGTPTHMSYIAECRSRSGCWADDELSVPSAAYIAAANPATIKALLARIDALEAVAAAAREYRRITEFVVKSPDSTQQDEEDCAVAQQTLDCAIAALGGNS